MSNKPEIRKVGPLNKLWWFFVASRFVELSAELFTRKLPALKSSPNLLLQVLGFIRMNGVFAAKEDEKAV